MAEVKVEYQFVTTFNQREFSLVCRALAGHEIRPEEEILAVALNTRLLALRSNQLQCYLRTSEMALSRAIQEEIEIKNAMQFLAAQQETPTSTLQVTGAATRFETDCSKA